MPHNELPFKGLLISLVFLNCLVRVKAEGNFPLVIEPSSPLSFSQSFPGDSREETVSVFDSDCSEFKISGRANASIEMMLPDQNTVLRNANYFIPVKNWQVSVPLVHKIGPEGTLVVKLGATRSQIPPGFPVGMYFGLHTLKVRYVNEPRWQERDARHTLSLYRPLLASKLNDLRFPDCFQGDPSATVAPLDKEKAASLQLMGEPNRTVFIKIPAPKTVVMKRLQFSKNTSTISISRFDSNPEGYVTLDYSGRARVFIGATREAISIHQSPGSYEGSFVVRVNYL